MCPILSIFYFYYICYFFFFSSSPKFFLVSSAFWSVYLIYQIRFYELKECCAVSVPSDLLFPMIKVLSYPCLFSFLCLYFVCIFNTFILFLTLLFVFVPDGFFTLIHFRGIHLSSTIIFLNLTLIFIYFLHLSFLTGLSRFVFFLYFLIYKYSNGFLYTAVRICFVLVMYYSQFYCLVNLYIHTYLII